MKQGARYNAVIELYETVMESGRPADQVLHFYFKNNKFIGSKDRKFISETVYAVLRHHARLGWWLDKTRLHVLKRDAARAAVLIWLRGARQMNMAEIDQLFDGSGYAPDPLLDEERDILNGLRAHDFMPAGMPQWVRLECPEWAFNSLQACYGAELEQALAAMQEEAPLDIRVNTLKAGRAEVLARLRKDGFDVSETPFSPLGLRLRGRPPFSAHPLYQDGAMDIQDEGSQILALACGAKPGEWVVDFCAGAGGKTLALAAQMQNKGRIWACDVEARRLDNNRKRLRRAGVHCVEMHVLSSEDDAWVRKHAGKADCVLIDAPCSGVGTWRRNPFMRWQQGLGGHTLDDLVALQQRILQSAARLVKPGGRLVYATCSLLPEENAAQVETFLSANAHFQPQPISENWAAGGFAENHGLDLSRHFLQMAPHSHNTDGFFVATMRRVTEQVP